jgi:hypothetical protein
MRRSYRGWNGQGLPRNNNIIGGLFVSFPERLMIQNGFESFETVWNPLKLLMMFLIKKQ